MSRVLAVILALALAGCAGYVNRVSVGVKDGDISAEAAWEGYRK